MRVTGERGEASITNENKSNIICRLPLLISCFNSVEFANGNTTPNVRSPVFLISNDFNLVRGEVGWMESSRSYSNIRLLLWKRAKSKLCHN